MCGIVARRGMTSLVSVSVLVLEKFRIQSGGSPPIGAWVDVKKEQVVLLAYSNVHTYITISKTLQATRGLVGRR